MAAQLRPLKGREVLRKLRKAGFEIVRIKGSAYYLKNPRTGKLTSVHVHGNRDIPLGTLRAIVIEQAGLSPEPVQRTLVSSPQDWTRSYTIPHANPNLLADQRLSTPSYC